MLALRLACGAQRDQSGVKIAATSNRLDDSDRRLPGTHSHSLIRSRERSALEDIRSARRLLRTDSHARPERTELD